jgi:acetyl-CoA carboxylase biotin carboxylase subunit
MFKKILIANRGEIALRIIRACRDLNIESVAVYSQADKLAPHVMAADQVYEIGPAPSAKSYLAIDKIIEVAIKSGAEAIHPGYGFLAENSAFAEAVKKTSLVFIGPSARAMNSLGDKISARNLLQKSGVPMLPGSQIIDTDHDNLASIADSVGYPLLVKASAGGGGKGMRIVRNRSELPAALRGAKAEANSAFGDGRVYLEKFLESPRHLEIQILADRQGNCVYVGERECSIQRRHQKLIEEAPGIAVDPDLRRKMGETAVAAALASGYVNAGTVEFLVDSSGVFYFLEINTRLQVEHPVTEFITGIDLVIEQIKIAAGERLSFKQEDIATRGHAIECRICAEDSLDFFPATGKIVRYREPSGPGIRVDSGIAEGTEITLHYDPLMAKLIAYGKDRIQAIARMRRALDEFDIVGVANNIDFHKALINHPKFIEGKISTSFIEQNYKGPHEFSKEEKFAIAFAAAISSTQNRNSPSIIKAPERKWLTDARRNGLRQWQSGNA